MARNDIFIPASPESLILRPLNQGMQTHMTGDAIPPQALTDAKDVRVTPEGIQRRDSYASYASSNSVPLSSRPAYAFVPAWQTDGTQFNALITAKYLYEVGLGSLTAHYWPYSTGKIKTSSGIYLKGQATAWTNPANYIRVGDIVYISTQTAHVSAINSAALITLVTSVSAFAASTAYHIRRAFSFDDDWSFDSTVIDNTVLISDRTRPLYGWNGTTLSNYMTSLYRPGCVVFFKDRLFIGNIVESTGPGTTSQYRQMIRWTGVTGTPRSFAAADYLNLPYTPGLLRRLVPLGNLLIAYFEDAIFYGIPSNLTDLPYIFHRIQTPGIGLAGPHAVASGFGGHFFVGQDNIYFLGADPTGGPEAIGIPIVKESIESCANPKRIYAAVDPNRHRVVFGMPTTGDDISRIWSFDVRSKAWSYEDITGTMIANPLLHLTLTINDLDSYSATIDGLDDDFATIDQMSAEGGVNDLFVSNQGTLYRIIKDTSSDSWGTAPVVTFATKDLDAGDPTYDKTFLEVNLRLADNPSAALTFAVSASDNGGDTWSSLGNLTVASDEREGRLTFAFTGASVRFRFVCATVATPYVVTALVFRVKGKGKAVETD